MAHYEDYAQYYDIENTFSEDVPFYLSHAKQYGPRTLELACGTGRILIQLASEGVAIDGLDFSQNMLSICQKKMDGLALGEVPQLIRSDMAHFELPFKGYGLIYIPFRSFMHLFTQEDQLGCLRCAYEHLRPGGIFIVDVYAPLYEVLMQEPDSPFEVIKEYDMPNGNHVVRSDRFVSNDPVTQVQHCERRFQEFSRDGALATETVVPMDTRYTFRYELQLLLEKAGFEVMDVFGDYAENLFDGTGEIIMVGRKRVLH